MGDTTNAAEMTESAGTAKRGMGKDKPQRRKTGRSPEDRRAAILKAASEVFFEAGYEGACIDAIVARVGGSKRTIYSEFGSKEGLFAEMIKENVGRALEALAPDELTGHDLRSTLINFGRQLQKVLMSPQVLAQYRAIVHEGIRFPQLAVIFWESGPGVVVDRLAEALERYRQRGELRVDDCRQAAGIFVAMIRDNVHLRAVLGLQSPPTPKESDKSIAAKVDILLNGICARR